MKRYVVIVAGGKGLRMEKDLPKQFIPFQGKPLLMHTMEVFFTWDPAIRIILVLPTGHQAYWKMLCEELPFTVPHRIATGGETRFHSVLNGLQCITDSGWVAVHDGVRPFVSAEVLERCFREVHQSGAVIPVVPIVDSLRKKEENGSVPVDRNLYLAVQTPQVFEVDLLKKAYAQPYCDLFTDDASVVENMGHPVCLVEGNRENIKITTPFDLLIADAYFQQKANSY